MRNEDFPVVFFALFLVVCTCALVAGESDGKKSIVIKTKNGATIEGVILKELPAVLVVKTRFGNVPVKRVDVLSIRDGVSLTSQFKAKRRCIKNTDAVALLKLADWCKKNNLLDEASETYKEAAEIAGPHYRKTRRALASLAMKRKDYRLAVLCYYDLARRLSDTEAEKALQDAEDLLRVSRLKYWAQGNRCREERRLSDAIRAYVDALNCSVRNEPSMDGDVGSTEIIAKLLQVRSEHLEWLKKKGGAHLLATDRPKESWVFRARPANLRARSYDISIHDLRIHLEDYAGQWLALKGVYEGHSRWNGGAVNAIRLSRDDHPELAVLAYREKAPHEAMLSEAPKSKYFGELLAEYPYAQISDALTALAPGAEVVCYGRLRRRKMVAPSFVFEVWTVETTLEPETAMLAANLKKPLRCEFSDMPLDSVLNFVDMVTQTKVEFEKGGVPTISLTLSVDGRPTGYVIDRIAKECGLQWTRRGSSILMKRTLTERETALRNNVIRLASDKAAQKRDGGE